MFIHATVSIFHDSKRNSCNNFPKSLAEGHQCFGSHESRKFAEKIQLNGPTYRFLESILLPNSNSTLRKKIDINNVGENLHSKTRLLICEIKRNIQD